MAETIIVVGHKNPDNDAICAAIGYAELKNILAERDAPGCVYKPARLGQLPPETGWVLGKLGIPVPELIDQAVDGLEDAELLEIIDHHRIGGLVTAGPIKFHNLPIGSSATVVAKEFEREGIDPSKETAAMLLSALMTDTVLLKSPTATKSDHYQAEWLAKFAGVDALEWGNQVIKSRGSGADLPIDRLVAADAKEFQVGDDVVFIAQRETVDAAAVMEREDEIREYMRQVIADKGYRSFLLAVTDIIEEGSRFVCEGDCSLIDKAFGIEVDVPGGVWMPGVLSRKKQIAPSILALG